MSKKPGFSLLKQKITLSYFLLALIALIATGILYHGIQNILSIDRVGNTPNQKLYQTNEILTLIYDAESDARSYYLFRKKQDLDNYVVKLDAIKNHINECFSLCKDNIQQIKSLQSIRDLSNQQQEVIRQLLAIDRKNEQDLNYQRAFDEVYIQAYEIMPPTQLIIEHTIIHHDSVYQSKDKSNFFGKLKTLFSNPANHPGIKPDNRAETKEINYDTIIQSRPLPDSLLKLMKSSLDKLKMRDNYLQSKEISTETKLLHSDRILLDKIREIVASLETEELNLAAGSINQSKSIVNKTVDTIIWLAGIAFILIITFIILIFHDITKNKQYNLALETAKKNSDELVQVKEQFLAMMSHEIRTPLSSIIGFSEQLDKTQLNDKQKQYLTRIQMSSDFLLNLVNDTLDLLKINAGKIRLDRVRFNLTEVIREVYQNLVVTAQNKNIGFTYECDPVLDRDVFGDPLRFRQVLINLAGNAIKFTEYGFVRMVAKSSGEEKGILKIDVIFTDTGIGIHKEKQSLIFEEFAQADNSVTRKFGGTGLGLSIANKIVRMSGGNITLSSTPGVGSIFTVELIFQIASKSNESTNPEEQHEQIEFIKHTKILVVDDDETLLLLISSILTNLEISVDTAINGKEALGKLGRTKYDLIFTDVNMPEMNGFELMKKIQSVDMKVPVVAITANSIMNNTYQQDGFVNYLTKPFKENELLQIIINVLFPDYKSKTKYNNSDAPDEIPAQPVDGKTYSLEAIIGFVGNEPEAIRKIIKSFVHNSLVTINEIGKFLPERNFEAISRRAHKLIPGFKQFHLSDIVTNLEKLERYQELNISDETLYEIVQVTITASEKRIHTIEKEWLT